MQLIRVESTRSSQDCQICAVAATLRWQWEKLNTTAEAQSSQRISLNP